MFKFYWFILPTKVTKWNHQRLFLLLHVLNVLKLIIFKYRTSVSKWMRAICLKNILVGSFNFMCLHLNLKLDLNDKDFVFLSKSSWFIHVYVTYTLLLILLTLQGLLVSLDIFSYLICQTYNILTTKIEPYN